MRLAIVLLLCSPITAWAIGELGGYQEAAAEQSAGTSGGPITGHSILVVIGYFAAIYGALYVIEHLFYRRK